MANVTLLAAEGGVSSSGGGGLFILIHHHKLGNVGSRNLYLTGWGSNTYGAYKVPFTGVVTLATVCWYTYVSPYYIHVLINGVIQGTNVTSQTGELLEYNVAVSAGDTLEVSAEKVNSGDPANTNLGVGLMLGEV